MIKNFRDIVEGYYTAEELSQLLELNIREGNMLEELYSEHPLTTEEKTKLALEIKEFERLYYEDGETVQVEGWKEDYFKKKQELEKEKESIYLKAQARYKQARNKEGIIEDAKKIINAYEKEDFLDYVKTVRKYLAEGKTQEATNSQEEESSLYVLLDTFSQENFSNCFAQINFLITEPYFLVDDEGKERIVNAIRTRVALWYEVNKIDKERYPALFTEPTKLPSFFPVLHGRATDALAKMNKKSSLVSVDKVSHTATLSTGKDEKEVKAFIKEFEKLSGSLGVNTHKLLMTGIGQFTNNNHTGETAREVKETEVHIPLKEYASRCGYDIEAHATTTPDGQEIIEEKELKRAENELKNARKQINKDLEILYNQSLSWTENVKGKKENFTDYRIIDHKGIRKGYITFNFAKLFSQYLILLPIGQYSEALLGLDAYKSNAYSIGVHLSYHLNNDNNIGKGTANRLKVKTILEYTNLPSIEEIRKMRASWVKRIKEPLETALDDLGGDYIDENGKKKKGCNFLENWEYIHSGGEPLTDAEARALINDYSTWVETLIGFSLKDAPDHTERLEAKAQRIAEAEAKKSKRKPKKKKKSES